MGAEHVHRAPIDATWLEGTLASIVNAYLPIPDIFERSFWNSSFLALVPARSAEIRHRRPRDRSSSRCRAAALRRSRMLLALYTAGTLAMLAVFAEKSSGYMRHYGHLAILFIAMLWLSAARGARTLRADRPGAASCSPSCSRFISAARRSPTART